PCSLAGITAVPECHNASILVIWELAEGGEGNTVYIATAEASDHTYLSCNGTGTNCTLRGAQCDLHYTVIVAASSDRCSSLRSPPYRLSMPCPPSEVTVRASCEDHSALVSWTSSPVAATYYVVASAADGHTHTCSGSSSTNCSLSGLHCDEQYTVYVTASHENCTSMASHNVTFSTCQPEGLSVAFHCSNESAVLSW
uniref:Fibronectin type III domain containing 7b n=1 Tax=Hippocampus comes TaxID=109280 RepID=A0A3Q2X819_HIPCM